MPKKRLFFAAKNVRSNVRELEGALRKILAYSRFNQKDISIALAREELRDPVHPEPADQRREHPEDGGRLLQDQGRRHVQQEAPGQHRPAAPDRHVPGQGADAKEPAEIGELFGGRDHTTVLHAVRKIGRAPAADRTQPAAAHVLEQTSRG